MKSKHCRKLISLLNFDDTSDVTKDFAMAVIILRIIILWASHSWFCDDKGHDISLKKLLNFAFQENIWEDFVMLVVAVVCVDVLFHLILFISCFSTSSLALPSVTSFIFTVCLYRHWPILFQWDSLQRELQYFI